MARNDDSEKITSIETVNGVTTTYEDGSTTVEHTNGQISADSISGGVHFTP